MVGILETVAKLKQSGITIFLFEQNVRKSVELYDRAETSGFPCVKPGAGLSSSEMTKYESLF